MEEEEARGRVEGGCSMGRNRMSANSASTRHNTEH